MKKIIIGLYKCYRYKGILYTIRFIVMDILGNQMELSIIDGHTKELLFQEKQALGIGNFSQKFNQLVDLEQQELIFPNRLYKYIDQQYEITNKLPRVLDVGCGIISFLVYAHHQRQIKLTGVDILANSYKELLCDYGYEDAIDGIELIESAAENLKNNLLHTDYDIVHCNNALDHTDDPRKSLQQMVDVTRTGGYIIISGNVREGTHESWDGIHMHDLYIENDGLFREGKSGDKTRLDEKLPVKVINSETSSGNPVDKMIIVYEKINSG